MPQHFSQALRAPEGRKKRGSPQNQEFFNGLNRILCGRSYCTDYLGYVLVDAMGNRLKLSYISTAFPALLKRNGLRPIRFHDLRHSSASLLLASHVPLKQIQEWLGHSDFSTTANIYAHLDAQSKTSTADAMLRSLGLEAPGDSSPE